jgi:hypothetical protein
MAGACATLWQAFPENNNMQIMDAVQKSADHYYNPDNKIGYGIPDFSIAWALLQDNDQGSELLTLYPNPADDHVIAQVHTTTGGPASLEIFDMAGKFIRSYLFELSAGETTKFVVNQIDHLPSGIYLMSLVTPDAGDTELLFIK